MIMCCDFMGTMGVPAKFPNPPPQPHLYSQQLQLKLYQAFIFSIPILFSIILLLLFYLFYLKKRASSSSSSSSSAAATSSSSLRPAIPHASNGATFIDSANGIGLKEIVKLKLPVILYDENSRDCQTLCCVCLGEFMVKEELHQLETCNHIFHIDCISLWLHSNSTCPLCRCSVLTIKNNNHPSNNNININIQQNNATPNANGIVVIEESQDQLHYSNYIVYTPPNLDLELELDTGLPILQAAESVIITIQRANPS